MSSTVPLDTIVALAKRRGFIYQGSELYGGLAGTWDYGPYGVLLKNNIKALWWRTFVDGRDDMFGVDAAIIMNPRVWEASGHVAGFADPMVEDMKNHKRYRADHLLEEHGVSVVGMSVADMAKVFVEKGIKSPDGNPVSEPKQFNMMFRTHVGAAEDSASIAYLRPETAQGMFVNYKNVVDSLHPKLPFGLGQIGKAFRNEITPRDFLFRTREFEQMEIEYFIRPAEWETHFEAWRKAMLAWISDIGLDVTKVHELEVPKEDLAHYSKRTIDFEYAFPFGTKELYGLAYRTDFDLGNHTRESGVDLSYRDDETGDSFMPHVIEPTFGVDRTVLALIAEAYTEDELGGEKRVYLKLKPSIAPVKAAVSPLLKNKPELVTKAQEVYGDLKKVLPTVMWDDNGNIGKRYRRQDEIGTPFCVTIDFDTLESDTVTVRDRDTGEQTRIAVSELAGYLGEKMK
ncbi:MAG: glycine--tRNA ligase [Candidatus Yonathbacteria bacterium]|nr:glycine--tRNA ligase [Candidatus Yonathbacteria bacterium]